MLSKTVHHRPQGDLRQTLPNFIRDREISPAIHAITDRLRELSIGLGSKPRESASNCISILEALADFPDRLSGLERELMIIQLGCQRK